MQLKRSSIWFQLFLQKPSKILSTDIPSRKIVIYNNWPWPIPIRISSSQARNVSFDLTNLLYESLDALRILSQKSIQVLLVFDISWWFVYQQLTDRLLSRSMKIPETTNLTIFEEKNSDFICFGIFLWKQMWLLIGRNQAFMVFTSTCSW